MRTYKAQKAGLTRALNLMDARERQAKVLAECKRVLEEWTKEGRWPDDWHRWNRALSDVGLWLTMDDLLHGTVER